MSNSEFIRPNFMFATGIENSYPTIALPDGTTSAWTSMEKTGHYRRWQEDFDLVKELGIEYLRYGPPYYRVHCGPGALRLGVRRRDLRRAAADGHQPIADLCHFGVPDWVGNFQNPDSRATSPSTPGPSPQRYPWVQLFTPVNEIFVAALFSGAATAGGTSGYQRPRPSSPR